MQSEYSNFHVSTVTEQGDEWGGNLEKESFVWARLVKD